ncbi:unnamed protein product [Adineta steineri]|uniref:Uncharacterized protein n=1 Tax=Adineta steineri TaxID=433720 RepID=A0A815AA85_9BILA|nr:unnamed protein product [Adineta steineri]
MNNDIDVRVDETVIRQGDRLIEVDYVYTETHFSTIVANQSDVQLEGLNASIGEAVHSSMVKPFTDHLIHGLTTTNIVQEKLKVTGQGIVIIEMNQPIAFTLKLTPANSNR